MNATPETKKQKKKGPIRFEAIVPVLVLSTITFVYFHYYFDHHVKKIIEYVGTQGNGAEVNVGSVNTSFLRGSFSLNDLEITDKERPTHDSLAIQNIHFQFMWDALLRMKFVVDDASISNIQIQKPRKTPGKVLPPEPAHPSKIDALQLQVISQIKNKYGANVLGDIASILQDGGDYKAQIDQIRGSLKSEKRVNEMITDVKTKKEFWDGKIKTLSDTSKIKEIEKQIQVIQKEKNFIEQAKGVKQITDSLGAVQKQYKDIQEASKQLQAEVNSVAAYPKELQSLVQEDVASLKDHFKIPKIDVKDMAMNLFAGQFAEYIAKARKYQALAKQYIPEKKEQTEEVIPPKRSEGKNYRFPITTGYPLFWLKRAAISSSGTKDSYSGNVSGELTNVTTSPKLIMKPLMLNLQGDFPASQIHGVKAVFTLDHTREVGKQSALIQVNSFAVPEKMFVNSDSMKFGFTKATGTSTISAQLEQENVKMSWNSAFSHPQFVVETSSSLAKEMLTNVLNSIPVININGSASGTFANLNMDISSNLGDELAVGVQKEVGAKLTEAQQKISALIDERINKPKEELLAQISGNNLNVKNLGSLQELFAKNQDKIKEEIAKIQKGGSSKAIDDIKEQGKKLFKGIKF